MIVLARTTLPPKAWPMLWWPRQTPRIGTAPESFSSTSSDTPAWSGVQGPGEMTMRAGPSAAISATVSASLRTTFTSCPNSPKYWTRL